MRSSGKRSPCPICDRTKDADCRIAPSGLVLCHTIQNGFKKGELHPERSYVFCGQSDEGQGFGIWLPQHVDNSKPQKTERKTGSRNFDYFFWDGTPTPAQRYRRDFNDGRPKEIKWCKGGLKGRRQVEVAPYQWHVATANLSNGDQLFIVRGELKAEQLSTLGLAAISLINQNDERLIVELRSFIDKGSEVVLVPDCDLADLQKWYTNITAALPQVRHLLCPFKGMDWSNPPADGGLGIEDWLNHSKPSTEEIKRAITSTPWQPVSDVLLEAEVDIHAADKALLEAWGNGWVSNVNGAKKMTKLNAGLALTMLRKQLPNNFLRLNIVTGLVEVNGIPIEESNFKTLYVDVQARGWEIGQKACMDVIIRFAQKNRYDPIAQYLNYLAEAPDITPIDIEKIATTYLGTTNSDFDLYMKIALLGAVARRFDPGCQFDTVVTLDGDGRIGKSSVWIALASPDWHSSSDAESDKDFLLILHQAWIYEQAELDYLASKKQTGQLKNLITTRKDSVRAPYGTGVEQRNRQGIMVGTVNGQFLRGDAALRGRFLVIQCPQSFEKGERIDIERITRDRDSIWKAAILAYRCGEPIFLNPKQLATASNLNLLHSEEDHIWSNPISSWLAQPCNARSPHTSDEILIGAGVRNDSTLSRADQMELSKCMQQIGGWHKDRIPTRRNGRKSRFWCKVETR